MNHNLSQFTNLITNLACRPINTSSRFDAFLPRSDVPFETGMNFLHGTQFTESYEPSGCGSDLQSLQEQQHSPSQPPLKYQSGHRSLDYEWHRRLLARPFPSTSCPAERSAEE